MNIKLSNDEYNNLICALAGSKADAKTLQNLPAKIQKDLEFLSTPEKNNIESTDKFIQLLKHLDSKKPANRSLDFLLKNSSLNIAIANNREVAIETAKLIFNENLVPGQIIKLAFAEILLKAGIIPYDAIKYYSRLATNQANASHQAYKFLRKAIQIDKSLTTNLDFLCKLIGGSHNTQLLAVQYADESVLHYLIGVSNQNASGLLEKRLSGIKNGKN